MSGRLDAVSHAVGMFTRRALLLCIAVALLATSCSKSSTTKKAATQAAPAPSQPSAVTDGPRAAEESLLFVQDGTGGSFTPITSGNFKLTLTGVEPDVLFFSDRPYRDTGHVPIQQMVDGIGFKQGASPPNAVINVIGAKDNEDMRAVEITNPSYDAASRTMTWDAHPLRELQSRGLSYLNTRIDDHIPEHFGRASLFIDNIWRSCRVKLLNGLFGEDMAIASSYKWDTDSWVQHPQDTIEPIAYGGISSSIWKTDSGIFRGCGTGAVYVIRPTNAQVKVDVSVPYGNAPIVATCTVPSPYTCKVTTNNNDDLRADMYVQKNQ